jgi:hypothetical protein
MPPICWRGIIKVFASAILAIGIVSCIVTATKYIYDSKSHGKCDGLSKNNCLNSCKCAHCENGKVSYCIHQDNFEKKCSEMPHFQFAEYSCFTYNIQSGILYSFLVGAVGGVILLISSFC